MLEGKRIRRRHVKSSEPSVMGKKSRWYLLQQGDKRCAEKKWSWALMYVGHWVCALKWTKRWPRSVVVLVISHRKILQLWTNDLDKFKWASASDFRCLKYRDELYLPRIVPIWVSTAIYIWIIKCGKWEETMCSKMYIDIWCLYCNFHNIISWIVFFDVGGSINAIRVKAHSHRGWWL